VLGAQLTLEDVDVELLSESVDCEGGQLAVDWVDVGQVVADLAVTVAAQREAAVVTATRHEGGGETAVREREADADVAAPVVTVRRVGADVDRLVVSAYERIQPRTTTVSSVAPSPRTVIVSMRLRTPRNASRWFM
jgi:hypothetical protein